MKQAKIDIIAALRNSTALTDIVGTRITDAWPSAASVFPCVSYLQVTGLGEIADGRTIGFNEIYQVSLFAKPATGQSATMTLESMAEAVVDAMDELGAVLIGNSDLALDDGSGVKHKPLRFRYITRR